MNQAVSRRQRMQGILMACVAMTVAVLLATANASATMGSSAAPATGASANDAPSLELQKLQRMVVRDRDRAKRRRIRLGGLSDGVFEVRINQADGEVVIIMPILRAPLLDRTRVLLKRRYGDAPIRLQLSRLARLHRDGSGVPARPGRPLLCPARHRHMGQPVEAHQAWNAKRLRGRSLPVAEALAKRRDCTIRPVIVDGMSIAVRHDLRYSRVNVVVRRNRITHIVGIF